MKTKTATIKKALLMLIAFALTETCLLAQSKSTLKFKNDTTVIVSLQRQHGFGPAGNISYGISSLLLENKEAPGLIPNTFKKNTELRDVEYFYNIHDIPQYYYQRFVTKNVSLTELEAKLRQSNLSLKDTSQLSRTPTKCGFYIAVGKDTLGQLQIIVDKNNNQDFSDDPVFALPKSLSQNQKVASQISVDVEFMDFDKKISTQNITCAITGHQTTQGVNLMISYPMFNIARVKFENQNYIICSSFDLLTNKLYILPDIPYFANFVGKGGANSNSLVKIGSADLRFQRISNNGQQILLTGKSVKGLSN